MEGGLNFNISFDAHLDPKDDIDDDLPDMAPLNSNVAGVDDDNDEDNQIFNLLQQIQLVKQSRVQKRKAKEVVARGEESVITFKKQATKIIQATKKNRTRQIKELAQQLENLYGSINEDLVQYTNNYHDFMKKLEELNNAVSQKMDTVNAFTDVLSGIIDQGHQGLEKVEDQLKRKIDSKVQDVAQAVQSIKGEDDSIKNLIRQMIPQNT